MEAHTITNDDKLSLVSDAENTCTLTMNALSQLNKIKETITDCKISEDTYFNSEDGTVEEWHDCISSIIEMKYEILKSVEIIREFQYSIFHLNMKRANGLLEIPTLTGVDHAK